MSFTRRDVLALAGTAAVGLCVAAPVGAASPPEGRHVVYRRSSKGRRASRAVKIKNANLRYKTKQAAEVHLAHPGDTSQVVPLDVSHVTFKLWFPEGVHVVDLRQLQASR